MTEIASPIASGPTALYPLLHVAGLAVHDVDEAQCVAHVIAEAKSGRGGWVVTPNADIARLCAQDPALASLVHEADLVVADGMPLVWVSRIIGTPLRERVCGSNLAWSVAKRAAEEGLSLFLLGGGRPDTAGKAAAALQERYPSLKIAGTICPAFGFEHDAAELKRIRDAITATKPDIIYTAVGFPKAENLIRELRAVHPQGWWIGVGISLSFICGEIRRPPAFLQAIGLEWAYRMVQEPGRLIPRYLWHDLPFVLRLLSSALLRRVVVARAK